MRFRYGVFFRVDGDGCWKDGEGSTGADAGGTGQESRRAAGGIGARGLFGDGCVAGAAQKNLRADPIVVLEPSCLRSNGLDSMRRWLTCHLNWHLIDRA